MKKILIAMLILASFPLNTASVPVKAETHLPVFVQVEPNISGNLPPEDSLQTPAAIVENTTPQTTMTPEPSQSPEPTASPTSQETEAPGISSPQAIEAEPVIETITLSFAGDCTIGDDDKYTWNSFDEKYAKVKDSSYFFSGVIDILGNDDFTLVNLEGVFTKETKKANKEFRFKGDPAYVDILVKGSVEGVTLANNHTLDYFEKGLSDTIETLNAAGIDYTYFDTYFIKDIKGMTIGFLGYKCWTFDAWCNALLVKQVKEMREKGVDFIVASYHWGQEKSHYPNAAQRKIAHFAIDNGVDLVIGHHPHVLQGLETYKGKNIFYSLGNFCYGGSPNPIGKDTMIYQHIIKFDAEKKSILETEYRTIPARVTSDPTKNDYRPIVATGEDEKRIMELFERISKGLNEEK